MVLQRTIDNLKERPKHEREAVAFWIAVAVVLVLLAGWAVFFFRNVSLPDLQPAQDAYNQALKDATAAQTNTANSDTIGWVSSSSPAADNSADSDADSVHMVQLQDETSADTQSQ